MSAAEAFLLGTPLDINAALADDLRVVPGVGARLAERIVRDRLEHGPFRKIEDIQRVRGVGPKLARRIAAYARAP